mmetsp:Transcript_94330/g.149162  ORF Transcript_94330/g.149162 Transcript_94330/m.149162 type:complete len:249 (+) Transcript_94330:337-1083(+)
MSLLVAPNVTDRFETGVHYLDVMLWRRVESVGDKSLTINRVHMVFILLWQGGYRSSRSLSKRKMVNVVRNVRISQVQVLVLRMNSLEMNSARNSRHLHKARNAATLRKNIVIRRSTMQVAFRHLGFRERGQSIYCSASTVLHVLARLRSSAIKPDSWKTAHFLSLARLLEVHAIDLQRPNVSLGTICIRERAILAGDLRVELRPRTTELTTMRAPIGIEIHERKVVCFHYGLEVIVLELVTRRAPICI